MKPQNRKKTVLHVLYRLVPKRDEQDFIFFSDNLVKSYILVYQYPCNKFTIRRDNKKKVKRTSAIQGLEKLFHFKYAPGGELAM